MKKLTRRQFLSNSSKFAACGALASSANRTLFAASADKSRPNVLFIIVDDHSPNLHSMLQESPVETPNMERLAKRCTQFSLGYCPSPGCCPSRTSFLTGVRPSTSGVYFNSQAYRKSSTWISGVDNLPQHFKKHGYLAAGYGKIFHNRFQEDDTHSWTEGYVEPYSNEEEIELREHTLPGSLLDVPGVHPFYTFGVLPDDWDREDPAKMQQDTRHANQAIEVLRIQHDRPFFLACGFWRPHVHWTVPRRYFDMHPLESIEIPEGYRPDDLEDIPKPGRWIATHRGYHDAIVRAGKWRHMLQAYYAAVSYVDEQVGWVLDALEASAYNDNTIIVFAGDNGWHTGEKNHWSKFVLWENACRVPFMMSVPEMIPRICDTPASLLDIYPTLLELCDLPKPATHELEGFNLTPILSGSTSDRGNPVVMTYGRKNHAVRSQRFRYIRYRNGDEELYDHFSDRHEWENLAADPRFKRAKVELAAFLPAVNAPDTEHGGGDSISNWGAEAFN